MSKIIFLQPYLTPYRIELFNEIAESNLQITVISYARYERRRKWQHKTIIKFNSVALKPISIPISYVKNIRIPQLLKLVYYIWKIKPKYIITAPNIEGIVCAAMQNVLKYRAICWLESTCNTEQNVGFIYRFIRKIYHSRVKRYVVPGEMTYKYLESNNYLSEDNLIEYIPNTVNDNYKIQYDEMVKKFSNIETIVMYYSGNNVIGKGVDLLVSVLINNKIQCDRRKLIFEFYGAGEEVEIPINKSIKIMGFLEGSEYTEGIAKSHIFVLPSRRDCNPLTAIEALKSGCVILVSNGVGSYPETVKGNGIVFEKDDEQALVSSINEILKRSDSELLEMAKKSFKIGELYSHKKAAKIYQNLLK